MEDGLRLTFEGPNLLPQLCPACSRGHALVDATVLHRSHDGGNAPKVCSPSSVIANGVTEYCKPVTPCKCSPTNEVVRARERLRNCQERPKPRTILAHISWKFDRGNNLAKDSINQDDDQTRQPIWCVCCRESRLDYC